MLFLLVIDWCVYWFWNEALFTGFGLMMFLLFKDGYVYWLWNGALVNDWCVYWFSNDTVCIGFWLKLWVFIFNRCSLYWSAIDAVPIVFGLIHVLSIEQKLIFVFSSLRHTLNEPDSSFTLTSPSCHSAGRVLTGLRYPLFQRSSLISMPSCTKGLS